MPINLEITKQFFYIFDNECVTPTPRLHFARYLRHVGQIIQSVILFFVLSFLSSCHQNAPHLIKIDEISIERNIDEMYKGYFENDSMNCQITFNTKEKKLHLKSIYDFHNEMTISLDHALTDIDGRTLYTLNVFVQTPDSVFLSFNDLLILINRQGSILNSWNLNEYHDFEEKNLSLSFVTPITFQNGKLNLALTAKLKVNTPESTKYYFSEMKPLAVLDIVQDSFRILPIPFPQVYQKGNIFIDFVPHFINFQGKILVSFSISDSLYIYNYDTQGIDKIISLRSRYYKTPDPYPFDSIQNFAFARKYSFNKMRYKNVYYDESSDCLLRMVSLPTEYAVPGVTSVKKMNNWSLIIYNLTTNQIIDELIFNSDDYQPYLITTKRGIMIWKTNPNIMDSLEVEIFKIQKN